MEKLISRCLKLNNINFFRATAVLIMIHCLGRSAIGAYWAADFILVIVECELLSQYNFKTTEELCCVFLKQFLSAGNE